MVTTSWWRVEFSGSPAVDSFPGLGLYDCRHCANLLSSPICPQQSPPPASYTTLTLHWFLRAFCLQLHCAQETEIQQNQLLCVGSQGRQGRMQAFHRHQSSMYNCQHCLTLPTLLYRCLKGESSAIWTQVDRGGHSPAHHLF